MIVFRKDTYSSTKNAPQPKDVVLVCAYDLRPIPPRRRIYYSARCRIRARNWRRRAARRASRLTTAILVLAVLLFAQRPARAEAPGGSNRPLPTTGEKESPSWSVLRR